MMVETYLRRGQRTLERAVLSPALRRTAAVAACTGSGFLLSAVAGCIVEMQPELREPKSFTMGSKPLILEGEKHLLEDSLEYR